MNSFKHIFVTRRDSYYENLTYWLYRSSDVFASLEQDICQLIKMLGKMFHIFVWLLWIIFYSSFSHHANHSHQNLNGLNSHMMFWKNDCF